MRGKGILLAMILFSMSVGVLQLLLCPTSLDQPETESDKIDETMANSVAQSAFQSQFYENKGQVNTKDVMFYGRMPGEMIGFGVSRIYLWMDGTDSCVFLSFEGASNVTPMGLNAVSRHTSYFLGDRGTYTGIRGYSQIAYVDLWPGIDLYYHTTAGGVKYEFRVAAGGDPNNIRVRSEGHDSLVIGESRVCISKGNGKFIDEGLCAFQDLTDIDVRFSSYSPHTFGFEVGDYNESKDLIIDPLVYSTFIGGSNSHCTSSVAVDSFGNAYVTGTTLSPDFPMVNAYNSTYGGNGDCFVFRLSADGSTLLYSTFVGGTDDDWASSIALDSSGNAYVAGVTGSPGFPTVNAYNSTYGGNGDCFVLKITFSQQYYIPFLDYAVLAGFSQLLQYIRQVALGIVLLVPMFMMGVLIQVALGITLLVPIFVAGVLMYRSATETTKVPPADYRRYKRFMCPHCNASYLYSPQHVIDSEGLRCQNCDREFMIGTAIWSDETEPTPIVRIPIAYSLLSRIRESRWNIFRRTRESE